MCTLNGACVSEAEYLDLTVRVGDEQRTLRYGERANVGGFEVVHGGLDRQTGVSTCTDAYVAWAGLAAWARAP